MTTREQIIAAAEEAGIHRRRTPEGTTEVFCWEDDVVRLYAIAFEAGRVAEREECAKVCESLPSLWPTERVIADECSSAIRARSTK